MRACRYLGTDFLAAYRLTYSPIIEQWALVAEAAEHEAEQAMIERARKT